MADKAKAKVGTVGKVVDASKQFGLRTLTGLISRLHLATLAGERFAGERKFYDIFGYIKNLKSEDFLAKYTRQDIASRIVDAPPGATWSNPPSAKDNDPWMEKWNELAKATQLWGAMYRADRLARMNHYSLLLFGFDDSADLKTPVNSSGVKELLYVRAIGSRVVEEMSFNSDPRSLRSGLPETYKIAFDDPATKSSSSGTVKVTGLKQLTVHHSRVVHVVENPLEDTVFGIPIMEKVFNLLDDLLKVAGGTSEMFWLSGRGGLQADIDKDLDIDPEDAAALGEEMDEFMHQLRRVIRTRGVTLTPLEHVVPNPKEIFDVIMSLISGTTGIPRRILLGSEAGQLASEQDRANWAERIEERRVLFAAPSILIPTTELLQALALLPEGDIEWIWPSAFIQNPLEKGQTMAQKARAIGNISRQTGAATPMPIVDQEEAREILGLEGPLDMTKVITIKVDPDDDDDDDDDPDSQRRQQMIDDEEDE